ncbi:diguanylate cyclase [Fervidobacterium riparium]|nr:hypothetical protein IB67_02505 [Fervidobacterium riparium]
MNQNNNSFEEEIRFVLESYLKAYLIDRDLQKVLKCFHPDLSAIGTGEDEIGLTYEQSVYLYQREMSQYPETIPYKITFFKASEVTPTVALALCGLEFNLRIEETDYKIERLRMSMLFVKEGESWLIYHLHISQSELDLSKDESVPLKQMEEKNRWLQEKLDERTRDLQNALEDAKNMSVTDELTKINNRREFGRLIKEELEHARMDGSTFSIILGDLDHFKKINDIYGHLMGDKVLKEVSFILSSHLRSSDSLARWGGEEFVILLPNTYLKEAITIAERLRKAINITIDPIIKPISISFGVTQYVDGDTTDSVLSRVDKALYKAKTRGRNRVEFEKV